MKRIILLQFKAFLKIIVLSIFLNMDVGFLAYLFFKNWADLHAVYGKINSIFPGWLIAPTILGFN